MQFAYVIVVLVVYAIAVRWLSKYLFQRKRIVSRVTSYALGVFEKAKHRNPQKKSEYEAKSRVLRNWADNLRS